MDLFILFAILDMQYTSNALYPVYQTGGLTIMPSNFLAYLSSSPRTTAKERTR